MMYFDPDQKDNKPRLGMPLRRRLDFVRAAWKLGGRRYNVVPVIQVISRRNLPWRGRMKAPWSLAPIALALTFPIGAANTDEALFKDKLQPILAANCAACHTGPTAKAGLSVNSLQDLLKGGKRGPAVQPGAGKTSLLVQFAKGEQSPRMPVGGQPLPESTIAALAAAIDSMQPVQAASTAADPHMKWLLSAPVKPKLPDVKI